MAGIDRLKGPIVVIDYHKGNLSSMARALREAGADVLVTDDPSAIDNQAAGLVLPGVGAFADAIAFMSLSGQASAVRRAVGRGVPFLGVCLGLQLIFEQGTEGAGDYGLERVRGLGILPGEAFRLPGSATAKVPHVGWNTADLTPAAASCPLFEGVGPDDHFYFTHSYYCKPAEPSMVMATTTHAEPFASAVWDGYRVFGTQFHPEKSSSAGARVMRNFVGIVRAAQAGGAR